MTRNDVLRRTPAGMLLPLLLAAAGAAYGQPTVGVSFQGSTIGQSGFFPPDTMGAIGPAHFVELINGRYAVYDRSDGSLLDASSLDAFWISAGVDPDGAFSFDPRVLFDHDSNRWFAVANDAPGAPNSFLVAVSQSPDPLDGWTGFAIDSDSDDQQWADFPTLGIDGQGLYVVANMFGVGGGDFFRHLLVIPKDDLLLAVPTVANATLFENLTVLGNTQPAVSFDDDGGTFEVPCLSHSGNDDIRLIYIRNTVYEPMLWFGPPLTPTPTDYPATPNADQPPLPSQKADIHTGGSRFHSNVVLKQGLIWAVHTVGVNGRAAIRFFKIVPDDGSVVQETIISHPELALYYPSIAVGASGNVVIGCSGSSATQPVSTYAVAGTTTAGITEFSEPVLLRAGLDDYERLDGSERNRWGDYSATTLDPTDPSRFWTIQEFVVANDDWATQVTEIILPAPCPWDCGDPADGVVNVVDFLALLAQWGTPGSCDVDGGGVGITDFLAMLANWGPCP